MADTAAKNRAAAAVYTTARSLGTGTTSTVTLEIWRMLSDHLQTHEVPLSGAEISGATGLSIDQIDHIFSQTYYQKYYGFRRFNSLAAWKEWAMSSGVLYNPELHDVQPEAELPEEDEEPEE